MIELKVIFPYLLLENVDKVIGQTKSLLGEFTSGIEQLDPGCELSRVLVGDISTAEAQPLRFGEGFRSAG